MLPWLDLQFFVEHALSQARLLTRGYRYLEQHPEEFSLDPEDTQLAGLGTGLLASAAVALSPTLVDLPWAAAEVIRVAFRMGVHVDEVSGNLEPRDTSGAAPDSWASVIPGINPEDVRRELEAHCAREVRPIPSTPIVCSPDVLMLTGALLPLPYDRESQSLERSSSVL